MESFPVLNAKKPALRGFTLVEMMVVLFIIVIVTTVAVMGQSTFNRSLILTDTAYTIAFSIREAQTLGLSSRVANNVLNAGYGVRFSAATQNAYILFADTDPSGSGDTQNGLCPGHDEPQGSPDAHPGDCVYDPSANPTELVRTYTLNRGFVITEFCGSTLVGGITQCSGTHFESLHLTFMRPSTDSIIFGRASNGNLTALADATIRVESPDGVAARCIVVSKVGLIGVTSCDD